MKSTELNIEMLNELLSGYGITVSETVHNAKSSESYIRTAFVQEDGFQWNTVVPYYIRRSGLFIDSEKELSEYLVKLKPFFAKQAMNEWADTERAKWETSTANITKQFFFVLLSFKEETDFPDNNNPARRIQDIKDRGYTIASIPARANQKISRILLPIPLNNEMRYEQFTPQFKSRIIRLLRGINAFEAKATSLNGLIPDHKFSEIRWDDKTPMDNPDNMSDDEVIRKFQLLDNQRNQQKREICRQCFQSGKRGIIYGIPFFYSGNDNWDNNIPTIGKAAEKGCISCAWYDIDRWRSELIKHLYDKD